MFSIETPANSINEVIALLKKQHNQSYVYRGQISEYNKMLPSFYRQNNLRKIDDYFTLPKSYKNSRIEILKATFAHVLVKKFGNITGNYLAQQYLAKSACIDITEDLDVTAFFAKMVFPKYDYCFEDDQQIGVIYRFNKTCFSNNLRPWGVKKNPFDLNATPDEYTVFINQNTVDNFITSDYYLKGKPRKKNKYYFIHENITSYTDLESYLDEVNNNHATSSNHDQGSINISFHRAKAQSGGMIQPKYLCRYKIRDQKDRHFGDVIGIEDIYNKYSMEKFYFRHSKVHLKYKKEDLWPGIDKDITLATLCLLFNSAKSSKQIEPEIKIADIIDFGYEGNGPLELKDI